MAYIEGFLIPVPNANREKFIEHARSIDALFLEIGATRVIECWGDDVPEGKLTDCRRAVLAEEDESVVFSWIEWPDRETRQRAYAEWEKRADTDERFRMDMATSPFDGKRMIYGGFEPVFEMSA